MSTDKINQKLQEKIFTKLSKLYGNQNCADCNVKSPTWISVDFGVIVCLNCSGAHRALGPRITRVRSFTLDSVTRQFVNIIQHTGNKVANQFYEYNIKSGWQQCITSKPKPGSAIDQLMRFVQNKYCKKRWCNQNWQDPVTIFKKKAQKGALEQVSYHEQVVPEIVPIKLVSDPVLPDKEKFIKNKRNQIRKNSDIIDFSNQFQKKQSDGSFIIFQNPKHTQPNTTPLSTSNKNKQTHQNNIIQWNDWNNNGTTNNHKQQNVFQTTNSSIHLHNPSAFQQNNSTFAINNSVFQNSNSTFAVNNNNGNTFSKNNCHPESTPSYLNNPSSINCNKNSTTSYQSNKNYQNNPHNNNFNIMHLYNNSHQNQQKKINLQNVDKLENAMSPMSMAVYLNQR